MSILSFTVTVMQTATEALTEEQMSNSKKVSTTKRYIEIMDTTLRDGEQTSGVSFSATEKLTIARLLLTEVKVDRIEIASARVSEGEFNAVKKITGWAAEAGFLDKIEVLTFVDGDTSVKWMVDSGAKVMNLLTKGSMNHLTHQLKKTPQQHFAEVAEVLALAQKEGIQCNVYLEDWSNGMRNSKEYVFDYLDFLQYQPVQRILIAGYIGDPYSVRSLLFPSRDHQQVSKNSFRFSCTQRLRPWHCKCAGSCQGGCTWSSSYY